jgi:antitoxin PrlF
MDGRKRIADTGAHKLPQGWPENDRASIGVIRLGDYCIAQSKQTKPSARSQRNVLTMLLPLLQRASMHAIHEVTTLTSKGQITLPKSIRQALGLNTGSKIAFDLHDGQVVVTRADAQHEDPAIGAFLNLIARDIEAGRNVHDLPPDLARLMREHADHNVSLNEDFDEDVGL